MTTRWAGGLLLGYTPCCQTAPKDASLTTNLFRLSFICHLHLPVKLVYFLLLLLLLNGSSYSFYTQPTYGLIMCFLFTNVFRYSGWLDLGPLCLHDILLPRIFDSHISRYLYFTAHASQRSLKASYSSYLPSKTVPFPELRSKM